MKLPEYSPPHAMSACVAVATSPLLVLMGFVLVVWQVIDTDTALALVVACTVWVLAEMHGYQRHIDLYNADYVACHLSWRSSATLKVLAAQAEVSIQTRDFVLAYVHSGRDLRPDSPHMQ
jgi:hypothetical protein